jgi:hypothetical protein
VAPDSPVVIAVEVALSEHVCDAVERGIVQQQPAENRLLGFY